MRENEGTLLPRSHGSLTRGVAGAVPGSVPVLTVHGGLVFGPREGRILLFGRNRPEVRVRLGEDYPQVSRRHGDGLWWVTNTGQMLIRVPPDRQLFKDEDPVLLSDGYTPLFIRGSAGGSTCWRPSSLATAPARDAAR